MNKAKIYNRLEPVFDALIEDDSKTVNEKLFIISELLHTEFEHFDWVGFYLDDPDAEKELILGPYVGAHTDHTRIKYGVGICGQSAESLKTFVVDDVNKEDNYLACSITVQSEIVVPIIKEGKFVAQLDIDSNKLAAMEPIDKEELEKLCRKLVVLF